MRIAHISDLHVLALAGAFPFRLFNKRLTGYANLRLRRGRHHRMEVLDAVLDDLARSGVDHVVVTGDLSNLALEVEFEAARTLLERKLGLRADAVTIVPGNHDVYTRGAERSHRFARHFADYLRSDLPRLTSSHEGGPFPVVHLRGQVAFIGLSTAVACAPFFASGRLGKSQLDALRRVLGSSEIAGRVPVFLQHHPVLHVETWTWRKRKMQGLQDADDLAALLSEVPRGLLLHGHLHRRMVRKLATRKGHVDVVGAPSASLYHPDPTRMAGYNVYDIEAGELRAITAHRFDPASGSLAATILHRS
jgi:3',5'-cyclic AMP phosphodiesterase CpdA